jgi:hypothetical protein
VAELAGFRRVEAILAGVEVLAGEALVQVQTLLLLGTALEEIKLAQLHYFWRFRVVRKHAVVLK